LRRSEVRKELERLRAEAEQIVQILGTDELISAEFVDEDHAAEIIERWKDFVDKSHDQYVALRAYGAEAGAH